MAKTEFLGLNLTDNNPLFQDWQKSIDGNNVEGEESNMQKIDKAFKDLSDKVDTLSTGIISVVEDKY